MLLSLLRAVCSLVKPAKKSIAPAVVQPTFGSGPSQIIAELVHPHHDLRGALSVHALSDPSFVIVLHGLLELKKVGAEFEPVKLIREALHVCAETRDANEHELFRELLRIELGKLQQAHSPTAAPSGS